MITNFPFEQELRQKSNDGDAVLTTSYADDYVVKGNGFQIRRRISIAAGATIKIVLDSTAVPPTSKLFILPISFIGTGGPILVDTYSITTYTGGTAIVPARLNSTLSSYAASVVKTGVTSTDTAGNDLRQYLAGATGNPQQVLRAGASYGGVAPYVIPSGTKIIMEITNNYTDIITFAYDVVWYEVPAKTYTTDSTIYSAVNSGWTAISTAGQNGVAYLIDNGTVLIDHSSTGTGGLSDSKAHRLVKFDAYQYQLFFRATSSSDIFYAKAMSAPSVSVCTEVN